jgi:hypothetical protein
MDRTLALKYLSEVRNLKIIELMKTKILLAIVLSPLALFAQWNQGGGPYLYPTNSTVNVGLGTSTPQHKLQVGDASTAVSLSLRGPDGPVNSTALVFEDNAGTTGHWFKLTHNSMDNRLVFSSYEQAQIMSFDRLSGNIGIGTAYPVARIDVNGSNSALIVNYANKIIDADLNDMIAVQSANKAATLNLVSNRSDAGPLGGLVFTTTQGATDSHRNIAGIVGGTVSSGLYGGGYLAFWTKNDNGDIPREQMRVSPEGRLGIGTAAPSAKFHLVGIGGNLSHGNIPAVSGDFIIQANTGSRSTTSGAQLEFVIPANTDGTNMYGQGRIITVAGNTSSYSATGKMILGTRRHFDKYPGPGSSAQWYYGDDLVIDGTGNIGIGSLNPDSKLTVKGKIHTEEVVVDMLVPGPDYVFEKDYNLLPLFEVETYINQNKHLPEVPSAKEMEANGLNLKEMNLILLKKVEELTLHLIEQEKQIKLMASENKQLKERVINLEQK